MSQDKTTKNVNPSDEYVIPIVGDKTTFISPSGIEVIIREQTGEDEDIISKVKNAKDGSSIDKFLAAIVISLNSEKPSVNDIKLMKSRDRNFIMFRSRLFSLGNEVFFYHTFINGNKTFFNEDLNKYDWDFSKGLPP